MGSARDLVGSDLPVGAVAYLLLGTTLDWWTWRAQRSRAKHITSAGWAVAPISGSAAAPTRRSELLPNEVACPKKSGGGLTPGHLFPIIRGLRARFAPPGRRSSMAEQRFCKP